MQDPISDTPAVNDPSLPCSDDRDARLARWPYVFGGISLVVAVFGFCMQGTLLASIFGNAWLMKLWGLEAPPPPPILAWIGGASALILVSLGILLAAGSAMILLRRPLGAKFVMAWAVGRLVMVVLSAAAGLVTIKPQAQWSIEIVASLRETFRKRGMPENQLPPLVDQAQAESDGVRNIAIFSLAFATWPLVMGFVLTRAKVRADIAAWGAPPRAGEAQHGAA